MIKRKTRTVRIGGVPFGGRNPLALIAGPCVIESAAQCLAVARRLNVWSRRNGVPWVFKASYDKANRTGAAGFRGPGLEAGLAILADVRKQVGCPILTDVHNSADVERVAAVVDALQIPAFLSRQTDLLVAAGRSGLTVNVKKGQFMAPEDMRHAIGKIEQTGNRRILVTERGSCFGYHNLVVDMRSLALMSESGYPVVFDATHSVQRPSAGDGCSAGDVQWVPVLARAAVAAGCDGLFMETAINPDSARCDGANSIAVRDLPPLWRRLNAIDHVVRGTPGQVRTGT